MNKGKVDPIKWDKWYSDDCVLLKFSMNMVVSAADDGDLGAFEHPWPAKSWQGDCVQSVLARSDAILLVIDMCAFGLQVQSESEGPGLNRKRTGLLLVGPQCGQLIKHVNRQCQCTMPHFQLHGAQLKRAERYCQGFCKAIAVGLDRELSLQDTLPH